MKKRKEGITEPEALETPETPETPEPETLEPETPEVPEPEPPDGVAEIELENLLEEISREARSGTLESETNEESGASSTEIPGEWEEDEELEKEFSARNPEETTRFLVDLADAATVSICAAISGVEAKDAERLWAFSAREKRRLYTAALPVIRKYGVDLPCEVVLAMVLVQIEAPRLLAARQIRSARVQSPEAKSEPDSEIKGEEKEDDYWS